MTTTALAANSRVRGSGSGDSAQAAMTGPSQTTPRPLRARRISQVTPGPKARNSPRSRSASSVEASRRCRTKNTVAEDMFPYSSRTSHEDCSARGGRDRVERSTAYDTKGADLVLILRQIVKQIVKVDVLLPSLTHHVRTLCPCLPGINRQEASRVLGVA